MTSTSVNSRDKNVRAPRPHSQNQGRQVSVTWVEDRTLYVSLYWKQWREGVKTGHHLIGYRKLMTSENELPSMKIHPVIVRQIRIDKHLGVLWIRRNKVVYPIHNWWRVNVRETRQWKKGKEKEDMYFYVPCLVVPVTDLSWVWFLILQYSTI